jgi:hypothetical protein
MTSQIRCDVRGPDRNDYERLYHDPEFVEPYLRAWKIAKGNHDSSEALAQQHRKDAAEAFLDGPQHRDSGTAEEQ